MIIYLIRIKNKYKKETKVTNLESFHHNCGMDSQCEDCLFRFCKFCYSLVKYYD